MSRPVVQTSGGQVRGTDEGDRFAFLGIPFAAPPVGELRFAAPVPPEPWSGVRDADAFGGAPPQRVFPVIEGMSFASPDLGAPTSEDCLYLNLWTPSADAVGLPVMVWIPGGGYVLGSGSLVGQVPEALAGQGAVVVSFNYRLGVLGQVHFDQIPGLDAVANVGVRDQLAALAWVQENIAAFGGDPANVTIFGASAGAMSVATLLGTPAAAGLFHRAIAQSGAAHNVHDRATAERVVDGILGELGLDRSDAATALRSLPVEAIVEAQERYYSLFEHVTWPGPFAADDRPTAAWAMAYQPVIDGDLLPDHPLATIGRGAGNDVPLLLGSTAHDQGGSRYVDGRCPADAATFRAAVAARMPGHDEGERAEAADAVVAAYLWPTPGRAEAGDAFVDLETDRIFRVPALRLAAAHQVHQAATYLYRFTWESPLAMIRSGHGLDIPFVLGTRDGPGMDLYTGAGPEADALQEAMQTAWLAFARSGDPSGGSIGPWPPFDPAAPRAMELGTDRRAIDALDEALATWDGLL